MNEEFKNAMQKKFDDLMNRIEKEYEDDREGFLDYLENAELVFVGTTFYDMSKDTWEISLDTYSASKGYTDFVKYAKTIEDVEDENDEDITSEDVADTIHDGLVKALNTSVVFCDTDGNYYM